MCILDDGFELPEDFDIQEYLKLEWGERSQVEARLHFDPEFAFIAHENRSNWDEFVELPDGSVEVMFKAPDLVWAASMALGFGPVLRVCSPPELAEMIRNWAEKIVERSG
jgi:predicted DNA-binding transcriptional regulator YafY